MPSQDSPIIFGLNTLADLTFRLNESQALINTLVDTQPKESGGSGGLSREDEVKARIENDFIKNLPPNFDPVDVKNLVAKFKALPRIDATKNIPLKVFLKQEIAQFQKILDIVRTMMSDMVKAIDGEVVMTSNLVVAINNIVRFLQQRLSVQLFRELLFYSLTLKNDYVYEIKFFYLKLW